MGVVQGEVNGASNGKENGRYNGNWDCMEVYVGIVESEQGFEVYAILTKKIKMSKE